MRALRITSIQSEVADYNCKLISKFLSQQLGIAIEFTDEFNWQDREKLFNQGEIDVCWMCSLAYILKADNASPLVELLGAPVMQPKRYQNQPVYFSDVVVHRESKFQNFRDLRGATWAYNEPQSHSGYNITRYQLAIRGERSGYFNTVIASGSHTRSLEMILARQIDASAIDSTVLDLVLADKPQVGDQIRVLDTWGPSPIPPWVILKSVDADLRSAVRNALVNMHNHTKGREILTSGLIDHFALVDDRYYDSVREMYRIAESSNLDPFIQT